MQLFKSHQNLLKPLMAATASAVLAACGTAQDSVLGSQEPTTSVQPSPSVPEQPGTVCALLSAEMMSAILSERVIAQSDDGALDYGHSDCIYYSVDGHHKRLDVAVDRLGGSAMRGPLGIPKAGPATSKHPYADIGDGAHLDHGVLFAMLGETRISIDLSRIDDKHLIGKRIVQSVKDKL